VQSALRLVRRLDKDIDPTVSIEVARRHDAVDVRRCSEDLCSPLFERLSRTHVGKGPVEFRRAGRRVVAAVREQEIEESVTIEIRQLDLVAPLGGRRG
jgi:hypothetical protein